MRIARAVIDAQAARGRCGIVCADLYLVAAAILSGDGAAPVPASDGAFDCSAGGVSFPVNDGCAKLLKVKTKHNKSACCLAGSPRFHSERRVNFRRIK